MPIRPTLLLIPLAATALLAGCASTSTGPSPASASAASASAASASAVAAQSAIASQIASQAAASPSPEASSGPCTTRSCIVSDAKQLVGGVAKDESVMTAMTCRKSTVKRVTAGVWTVHCTATYSDDQKVSGIASVLLSKEQVTWEPTGTVSG